MTDSSEHAAFIKVTATIVQEMQKHGDGFYVAFTAENVNGNAVLRWVVDDGKRMVKSEAWRMDDIRAWESIVHRLRAAIDKL